MNHAAAVDRNTFLFLILTSCPGWTKTIYQGFDLGILYIECLRVVHVRFLSISLNTMNSDLISRQNTSKKAVFPKGMSRPVVHGAESSIYLATSVLMTRPRLTMYHLPIH